MRFAVNVDRAVPLFVLPYAVWTMYVHLITTTHASFDTLLHGLPVVALIAAVATAAWFRLPELAKHQEAIARAIGNRGAPLAVLALAITWVALLSIGLPYPVFWWITLLAMFGAWMRNLRGESCVTVDEDAGKHATWIVTFVAA